MASATIEQVEELITVNAAATRIGVPRSTITNAILLAKLRAVRSGERVLVPAAAVDAFAAQRKSA